jgi:Protein of unknown function (DUF2752)
MNLSRLATIGAPRERLPGDCAHTTLAGQVYGWSMRRSAPVRTDRPATAGSATRVPSDGTLAGIAAAGAGGLVLAAVFDLSGGTVGLPCLLRSTTGLACPLCGTTRMGAALLHGDLGAALRFNAPVLAAGVVVAYLWTSWMLERWGLRSLPRPRLTTRARRTLLPVLVVVAVTFMVARNLPWEPFTALHV